MKVERRRWQERRGENLSATHYEGLYYPLGKHGILISDLSHGLRVLEIKDPDQYVFETPRPEVEVSKKFMDEALEAFVADKRFQYQRGEYRRAMGKLS